MMYLKLDYSISHQKKKKRNLISKKGHNTSAEFLSFVILTIWNSQREKRYFGSSPTPTIAYCVQFISGFIGSYLLFLNDILYVFT